MKKEEVEKIPRLHTTTSILGNEYGMDYILIKNAIHNINAELLSACLNKVKEFTQSNITSNNHSTLESDIICWFNHGTLIKTYPMDNNNQYHIRYLVSDEVLFDLENDSDINKIPVPDFAVPQGFPNISQSLDYVLKRKAGDLDKKGLFDLSILCLRKANQLMDQSPIRWNKQDYFFIVKELARANRFGDAIKEKRFIEKNYFEKYDLLTMHKKVLDATLQNCRDLNTALVESDDAPNCDEICGKYRKRIYSLSHVDTHFPLMTVEIWNCRLMFYPFLYGISKPKYCYEDDIFIYNNRPFIDDRTEEEKNRHEIFKNKEI